MRKILWLAALLGLFLLWENFTLESETLSLYPETLPEDFDGLRILQISDLHGRSFGREHRLLLQKATEAQPELICITGDLFEADTSLSSLEPLIRGLCDLAPVYYVTGNHEWQRQDLKACLKQMESWGATVLQNEYRLLQRGSSTIAIVGVDDPCGPYDRKMPQELMAELRKEVGEARPVAMPLSQNLSVPCEGEQPMPCYPTHRVVLPLVLHVRLYW